MTIKLLGIEIDRKTDILALAAFLISVSTIIYTISIFIQGHKVNLIPPETIMLKKETYETDGEPYIAVIATMAYVNSSKGGFNVVIKKEKVSFKIKSALSG